MEHINLTDTFKEFKELKNIDRATIVRILEDAFRSQLVKQYGSDEKFNVIVNPDKGDLEVWRNRVVVADEDIVDENLIAVMKDSFLNQPITTYNWRQGLHNAKFT